MSTTRDSTTGTLIALKPKENNDTLFVGSTGDVMLIAVL
jgi:hypothetical protein